MHTIHESTNTTQAPVNTHTIRQQTKTA